MLERAASRRHGFGVHAILILVLAVVGGQLVAPAPAAAAPGPIKQPTAATVTADALPTAQINGVVWTQLVVGDTVFAGGEFTSVRPAGAAAGTSESPRSNLMSYDIRTGEFTSFAPTLNGPVKALTLSADRQTLYVGGTFTLVDGQERSNIAAFSVATGVLTSFAPAVNKAVNGIVSIGQTLYIGGTFNTVQGSSRLGLAALDATAGELTAWAPTANGTVKAMVATPDRTGIVVAGSFSTLTTTTALGMGLLDATSGQVRPWAANTVVKNYGDNAAILSLNVDKDTVYAGGYAYGGGNFEGVVAADPKTGNVKWLQDCHGDTYDVAPVGDVVYTAGHSHYCSNIGGFPEAPQRTWYRSLALSKQATGTVLKNGQTGNSYGNFEGQPAPSLYNWFPSLNVGTYTGLSQGPWSVRGTSEYLVLAGEFTRVNGKLQQGLVRMAVPSLAPKLRGPQATGEDSTPTATAQVDGTVAVTWKANWDQDNQLLDYDVLRNGRVVKTLNATSQFWNRPTLSAVDNSGSPGVTYSYTIRSRDPHRNTVTSPATSVVFPSNTAYARLMVTDQARHQWRLGSAAGEPVAPDTGSAPAAMTVESGVTFGVAGALPADGDTAASFDGGANSSAQSAATASPATVSVEGWFKSTRVTGGALVGFGPANRSAGATVAGSRQVYLTSAGRLAYSVRPTGSSGPVTVTGSESYTDGKWHQLVAVQTATAVQLYVDGARVASVASAAKVPALTGTWMLGGAAPSDLPNRPTSAFGGGLDDVSVFGSALTAKQVRAHYLAGQPGYNVIVIRPPSRG